MWLSIFGRVVPDISKYHNAFIFRIGQSKNKLAQNTHCHDPEHLSFQQHRHEISSHPTAEKKLKKKTLNPSLFLVE